MKFLTTVATALVLVACGGDSPSPGTGSSAQPPSSPAPAACQNGVRTCMEQRTTPPPQTIDQAKTYTATVHSARGDFVLKLDPKAAPVTVNNFVYLSQQKFYDGLTFHRVEPGFVVQGGDPQGNGTGGLGYKLPNETNPAPWLAGSVGMASNPAGVSGCQFFVLLGDATYLSQSGVYNHFGTLTSGMDVLKQIRPGDGIKSIDIAVS